MVQIHNFHLDHTEVHQTSQVVNYCVKKCKRCRLFHILLCCVETSEVLNKLICSASHLFVTGVAVCSLFFLDASYFLFMFDSLDGWYFSWIITFCKPHQSNKLWLEQRDCGLMNITYWRRRKCDLRSVDLLIWSDLPAFSVTLLKVDFFLLVCILLGGKKLKASQETKSILQ